MKCGENSSFSCVVYFPILIRTLHLSKSNSSCFQQGKRAKLKQHSSFPSRCNSDVFHTFFAQLFVKRIFSMWSEFCCNQKESKISAEAFSCRKRQLNLWKSSINPKIRLKLLNLDVNFDWDYVSLMDSHSYAFLYIRGSQPKIWGAGLKQTSAKSKVSEWATNKILW